MPCKMLETEAPDKKSICTAPSFGRGVSDFDTISQAMITHVGRVAEKLRKQESAASTLTVFLHTNRHKKTPGNGQPAKPYYNSRSVELPHPTNATVELVQYAHVLLKSIFAFGYEYQKVGVMLLGLVPADYRQGGIFVSGPDERLIKLSAAVDKINHQYGRDKVRLAAAGYDPSWKHKRQWMSARYTTDWKEILPVK